MNLITLILLMGNMENNGHFPQPASWECQDFTLLYLSTLTRRDIESSSLPSTGELGEDDLAQLILLLSDNCTL